MTKGRLTTSQSAFSFWRGLGLIPFVITPIAPVFFGGAMAMVDFRYFSVLYPANLRMRT
jgi:hypothetical protein